MVILPFRLSLSVSAISCAAPEQLFICSIKSSYSFPVPFSNALTAAISVLLNIVFIIRIFCARVISDIIAFISIKISFKSRIFPLESLMRNPIPEIASAALSVGADRDNITFRRCVPPSAPFMPLFANTPNSAFMVSNDCPAIDTVPAHTSVASPNCATLVFDFCEVFAISSM